MTLTPGRWLLSALLCTVLGASIVLVGLRYPGVTIRPAQPGISFPNTQEIQTMVEWDHRLESGAMLHVTVRRTDFDNYEDFVQEVRLMLAEFPPYVPDP
jgi:hypothetical protein